MRARAVGLVLVLALLLAACGGDGSPVVAAEADEAPTTTAVALATTTSSTLPATTTTVAPEPATTTTAPPATTALPPIVALPPPERVVTAQPWVPYATVESVVLHHPADIVERVGFHESNHDGAQQQIAVATAVAPTVLETRDRGTGSQTAADVVVDPAAEIRAPVTGTVLRASPYTLYCDYRDEYAVIEPDDRPGWEVKVLHIVGLQVAAGDRVIAGETVLALHAHQLPFDSQVDELRTSEPAWPHVHIEVVDPTVPDRPTPGGGCT